MQSKDKVEQLKQSLKAKQEADARRDAAQGGDLSPGQEDLYRNKIQDLEKQLLQLEQSLHESQEKAKEAQDQYLRTYAEFDNFRKRNEKEKQNLFRYGHENLAKELLPVLDSLEKAVESAHRSPEMGALLQGVDLVLRQFLQALEKFGITPLDAAGHPFDPNYHEAVAHLESPHHQPHTVLEAFVASGHGDGF